MKFIKHKGSIQDAPIACLDPVSSIGVDIDPFDFLNSNPAQINTEFKNSVNETHSFTLIF